jgi:hypothetical protein
MNHLLPFRSRSLALSATALLVLLTAGAPGAVAPVVLYTDIVSGPTSGGENNQGAYLSVFGLHFGAGGLGSTVRVRIAGVEVGAYRSLGPAKGRPDVQQITVQVGALGNPTPGVPLPVTVTVDGIASNADLTFTRNPGRLLYVDNVAGNDATAVIGDIAHPFRYVQTPALYAGGAWAQVQPGDLIVMRGHGAAHPWTDVGFEHYFMRYRNKSGSAPTGATGSGPIAVMGYPGEDVYIRSTIANGMTGGCISAINGQSYPGMGQWAVIANLRIDAEGYDGPVSQEINGHHWRVVNNDLSASTAPRTGTQAPRMAGITGNGNASFWVGNTIHDIQGSSGECHGVYIDGDGSYEIAWNHIHDIRDGNGYQSYVNGGNGSDITNDISLHHNLIHDVSKHGINLADNTRNNVQVWNNVVYNVRYAGVRFNSSILHGCRIANNTFSNTNQAASPNYGALTNDWTLGTGSVDVIDNIFWVAAGTLYNGGANGVPADAGTISRNLWWGGSGSYAIDTAPVHADPLFAVPGSDFHLLAGSQARDAGLGTVAVLVTDDYEATRRPVGAAFDIGAYEYHASGGDTTPPVLSAITASAITATGATITWTTDETADTQVDYGATPSYGSSTTLVATLVTAHSRAVGGLTAGTVYHYRVRSRDAAGNLALSTDRTFTTATGTAPPTITIQPLPRTVVVGATATFSVTASGTPAPTYQWQRDTTDIPGATAPGYTTPATTAGDDGATFRCVVSNSAGSATSNAVTLSVQIANPPPATADDGGGHRCGFGAGFAALVGLLVGLGLMAERRRPS